MKIIDFGLSRTEREDIMTEYVRNATIVSLNILFLIFLNNILIDCIALV